MRRAILTITTAIALACAGEAAAQAAPFDSMVVFGDSLSDGGNLSLSLGLPRMRFLTNPGLVAVEVVAQHFGLSLEPSVSGGSNYAYGGAGVVNDVFPVPTVPAQVDSYFGAHPRADPKALYSIWGGANDIFYHDGVIGSAETLDQANQQIAAAAALEGQLIDRLQAAGARRIIVFNLPDVGLSPGGLPQDTVLSQTYNSVLNSHLAGRSGVVPVNMFAILHELVATPAAFGFANATTQACTVSIALLCTPQTLVQPNAGSIFVFADDSHPTVAAQLGIAQAVIAELTAPGQMSLLAEAPLALLRGHRAAVREELDRDTAGQGVTLFASGRAGRRRLDGDWAVASAGSDEGALTMGGIWRSGGGLALGAALTGGQSRVSLRDELGGFDAKELALSVFGQWSGGGGNWASLQAGLGHTDYDDIRRSFILASAFRTERSSSTGHDYSVELAGGRWLHVGGLRTGPFAAFSYDRVQVGDAAEISGDSTAMWFAAQTREAAVGRLGWSLAGATRLGGIEVQPTADLAYGHDFRADRTSVTAGLTTMNGEFDMPGYQPSRNWGEARLGLGADLGHGLRARLSYEGLFGDRGQENLGVLGVSYDF
jgi:outer membrane lipase/esterase